jgi:hypothetical protein
MDLATASRVSAGRGELAISIPPRTSAPSSSRVTVSGSSTDTLPAAVAARRAPAIAVNAYRSSSSVNRARPSTAGASVIRICCTSGSSTASRKASNPRPRISSSSVTPSAARADAAISSAWTSSNTASNSAVLFGKWW